MIQAHGSLAPGYSSDNLTTSNTKITIEPIARVSTSLGQQEPLSHSTLTPWTFNLTELTTQSTPMTPGELIRARSDRDAKQKAGCVTPLGGHTVSPIRIFNRVKIASECV